MRTAQTNNFTQGRPDLQQLVSLKTKKHKSVIGNEDFAPVYIIQKSKHVFLIIFWYILIDNY